MRKLTIILFVCMLPFFTKAQTANAGADKIIYLTSGNSVTLDGSGSSGSSYLWTEIKINSWDYLSGATITSPTSLTTTVTGLPQGVFYYRLAATTGGTTKNDTLVVRVNYAMPPSGTLMHNFNFSDAAGLAAINYRGDTTNFIPIAYPLGEFDDASGANWFLFRDRSNGLYIDNQRGKMVSTIQDGYESPDGYPRAEVSSGYNVKIDTSHTYCFEYKGYYPQNTNNLTSWYEILTMLQIHGGAQVATIWQVDLNASNDLIVVDVHDDYSGTNYAGLGPGLVRTSQNISTLSDFYNKAHTIRLTFREGKGYPGQTAFMKVELDGVRKYSRDTGQVGSSHWDDYVKFGGLYDWNNAMVNGSASTHDKKWQLVTEAFNIYDVTSGTVAAPTVSTSGNQTLTLPTNSTTVYSTPHAASGHTITSYTWSDITGGGTASITSSTSQNTGISGLSSGVHTFQILVHQDDGQTATATLTIKVNAAAAPTVSAGSNKTIILPTSSVTLTGSATAASGQTMTAYFWTKISGPGTQSFSGNTTLTAGISGLSEGTYVINLKGTQTDGQYANSTVTITVNAAVSGLPPVSRKYYFRTRRYLKNKFHF